VLYSIFNLQAPVAQWLEQATHQKGASMGKLIDVNGMNSGKPVYIDRQS
jgi:hypothetical protein